MKNGLNKFKIINQSETILQYFILVLISVPKCVSKGACVIPPPQSTPYNLIHQHKKWYMVTQLMFGQSPFPLKEDTRGRNS